MLGGTHRPDSIARFEKFQQNLFLFLSCKRACLAIVNRAAKQRSFLDVRSHVIKKSRQRRTNAPFNSHQALVSDLHRVVPAHSGTSLVGRSRSRSILKSTRAKIANQNVIHAKRKRPKIVLPQTRIIASVDATMTAAAISKPKALAAAGYLYSFINGWFAT